MTDVIYAIAILTKASKRLVFSHLEFKCAARESITIHPMDQIRDAGGELDLRYQTCKPLLIRRTTL